MRSDSPGAAGLRAARDGAADDTAGSAFGGKLEFLDAAGDLRHAMFESKVGLTSVAPSTGGLYEWSAASPPAKRWSW